MRIFTEIEESRERNTERITARIYLYKQVLIMFHHSVHLFHNLFAISCFQCRILFIYYLNAHLFITYLVPFFFFRS